MNKQYTGISKFLSFVLRHKPEEIGLTLDTEGWTDIDTLLVRLKQANRPLTRDILQAVVDTNDKKRFAISEDGLRIRANQGHSTPDVALSFDEKQPPEFLFHGTATRFVESIQKQGLIPGQRHYVHLSENIPTATEVGQRYGKPVILKINSLQMYEQGFKFYKSDNDVWLTKNIPSDFIIF